MPDVRRASGQLPVATPDVRRGRIDKTLSGYIPRGAVPQGSSFLATLGLRWEFVLGLLSSEFL